MNKNTLTKGHIQYELVYLYKSSIGTIKHSVYNLQNEAEIERKANKLMKNKNCIALHGRTRTHLLEGSIFRGLEDNTILTFNESAFKSYKINLF